MSTERNGRDKVKVVIINTEYIETDARNFKSIVQKLTGKDAAAHVPDNKSIAYNCPSPTLGRGMSFKDNVDNLLKLELPSFNHLFRSYADDQIRF